MGPLRQKYTIEGKAAGVKKDFVSALKLFEKGLPHATENQKAELYFLLGICQWNLRDVKAAYDHFQNAVKIDKLYKDRISKVVSEKS